MIWTIGYQRLRPERLQTIAEALDTTVLDCRSVPQSRHRGFALRELQDLLGLRYQWVGDVLGGRSPGILPKGLAMLRETYSAEDGECCLLLCMEESPGDCHRHRIAMDLATIEPGIEVFHIYRDEVVAASELERSMAEDTDYACWSLSEILADVAFD